MTSKIKSSDSNEKVQIHPSDELRVYGPYDKEKNLPDSPYITIVFDKFKAKISQSNTHLDFEKILNNELTGKTMTFSELQIKNNNQIQWIKNTRSRSVKEKKIQMDEIIHEGRILFTKHQEHEFTMRELAKRCDMTVGNLYAYVECKRDLWYAIILHDFQTLENIFDKIIQSYRHDFKSLIMNLATSFIKFAREDYARHKMLFYTPVPPPKINPKTNLPQISYYEEKYQRIFILDNIASIVSDFIKQGIVKFDDPLKLTYFLFGFLQGNIISGADYVYMAKKSNEEYDNLILEQLNRIIDQFTS